MRYFSTVVILVIVFNAGLLFGIRSIKTTTVNKIPAISLIDGDLVMRNGRGIVSGWFREMSLQDPRFTHAGLVIHKNGKLMVMHCYQEGNQPGLKIEPYENFINPAICDDYAIYHFNFDDNQKKKLINEMMENFKRGISFDNNFELNNGDDLYCTEWVAGCINKATEDSFYIKTSKVGDFCYYAPDNLYVNTHVHLYYQKTN